MEKFRGSARMLLMHIVEALAHPGRHGQPTLGATRVGRPAPRRRAGAAALVSARVLVLVVALVGYFAAPAAAALASTASPASAGSAPTISTDQSDYPPGATVTLTGAGWQPGEAVALSANDSVGNTWIWNDNVTADSSGGFTDSFSLPNWFVANYTATASGAVSGTATATFTDAVNLNIAGSDNTQHQKPQQQENLGSFPVGSTVALACPRGTGLTVSAGGLGGARHWGGASDMSPGTRTAPRSTRSPRSRRTAEHSRRAAIRSAPGSRSRPAPSLRARRTKASWRHHRPRA